MAEPVGTTLGALGVLGLLSVCIDSFNFIEDGRSVGKAFTLLRGEFANLRFRLLVWCRACKFFDEGGYDARLNHPELRPQILAQLNSICLLFMDAKKVIGKYDAPVSTTQLSTPGSSALFVEEGLHDFLKRIKETKSRAGFRGAFLWALKDKRAFQELVERLEKCISALELVTANLDLFEEPRVRRAIEIEIETLSDVDVLSRMVAASHSSHSGTAISDAASQRILGLRSQPSSHERSTASSDSQTFYTAHTLHGVDLMQSIAEESAFSCLDVNKPVLYEVLWLFSKMNDIACGSLFVRWLFEAGHETNKASVFAQEAGGALDAPTSYYSDSLSITQFIDNAEGSNLEPCDVTARTDSETIQTLSNNLVQISLAVQETFWDLKSELRNRLEHSECKKEVLEVLQATYSKLPPIVLAASDASFGRLPAIETLRERLSELMGPHDAAIQGIIFRHSIRILRSRCDAVYSHWLDIGRESKMEQWGDEYPLFILSGYSDPKVLISLSERYLSGQREDKILIRILAFRLSSIAYFWQLIALLESQPDQQAKLQNTQQRGGNETPGQLDENEWGRHLLYLKREDRERSTWLKSRYIKPSSRRLREEVTQVAWQYPCMSLRIMQLNRHTEAIVTFEAPPQSPYAAGIFQIHVEYPPRYPHERMKMRFLTKVYHPNVDCAGKICLDFLDQDCGYNPTTAAVVMAICALLSDPHTYDPLVPEIAATYTSDREEYTRCAKLYTKKYATLGAAMDRLAQVEAQQEAQQEASREELWEEAAVERLAQQEAQQEVQQETQQEASREDLWEAPQEMEQTVSEKIVSDI